MQIPGKNADFRENNRTKILSLPCLTLERALVLNQLKAEVAEKRWR